VFLFYFGAAVVTEHQSARSKEKKKKRKKENRQQTSALQPQVALPIVKQFSAHMPTEPNSCSVNLRVFHIVSLSCGH